MDSWGLKSGFSDVAPQIGFQLLHVGFHINCMNRVIVLS